MLTFGVRQWFPVGGPFVPQVTLRMSEAFQMVMIGEGRQVLRACSTWKPGKWLNILPGPRQTPTMWNYSAPKVENPEVMKS